MSKDWTTKITGGPIGRSPAPGKAGKKEYESVVEHAEHLKHLKGKADNGRRKKVRSRKSKT